MGQYKVGKIVKGNITGIEKYGIFVNLDNFYSGLIHISEVSNDFVKDISKFGEVGETIFVNKLMRKERFYEKQKKHQQLKRRHIHSRMLFCCPCSSYWLCRKK